jgi:Common central domain of tyrosinase
VGSEVRSGYFARDKPGTPGNPTPAPPWWPPSLTGWLIPPAFGGGAGALRRGIGAVGSLPTATDVRQALAKTTYPAFQNATESGSGLSSFPTQQMHNGMHGWIGGPSGQMSQPAYSPSDPIFYLHHCNIDRLWAMWQLDGHADEYPATGGQENHRRGDIMYPWTGGVPGYGTNAAISSAIPMPDFSAVGPKRNGETLDFRGAFGYTYDTLAVIGIGLDRTGSMNALTPDPMTTGAPDVTKWEAAKRGVSAFLQDCETVQGSGSAYMVAGVKTFRRVGANDFASVFTSPGYGLVKAGGTVSRAAFDSAVSTMSPGGSTPLADALLDIHATLVESPFGHVPGDERRYLAMLTDGLLTDGAPMSSIPDHSLGETAVFSMGFGTGVDVDYSTLAAMAAKGATLTTAQVFHGENAGVIDKFYSNALARAIGFTGVIDPVLELFAGEHAHVELQATSADDAFLITVQGLDFDDDNWTFHLHGPDGSMAYGEGDGHAGMHMRGHDGCLPDLTATRATGRLSLMLQRNNAHASCWVGTWRLMVAYKAPRLDAMVMPHLGELIFPVSAGRVHGPRYSRVLTAPSARIAVRNVNHRPAHRLDVRATGNNLNRGAACNAVVNVYARTRLRMEFVPRVERLEAGSPLTVDLHTDATQGSFTIERALARLIAPGHDLAEAVNAIRKRDIPKEALLEGSKALAFDPARLLAALEKRDRKLRRVRDEELAVVVHHDGPQHVHIDKTEVPGVYHVGVAVDGGYRPDVEAAITHAHDHDAAAPSDARSEPFQRVLSTAVALPGGSRRSRRRSHR